MSGLSTCRDCGAWIYWAEVESSDGGLRNVPYSDSAHTRLHWEDCAGQDYVTDVLGNSYRVTRCSRCKHSVYWETTPRGKRRPMDVYVDEDDNSYTPAGVCHFETCTGQAGRDWRRGQDPGYRREKRKETVDSNATRGRAYNYDLRRMEPWLKDLRLVWPCTSQDVTSAFRKLALETHPDMGGTDQAFIRIKIAYDQLRKLVPA